MKDADMEKSVAETELMRAAHAALCDGGKVAKGPTPRGMGHRAEGVGEGRHDTRTIVAKE